MSLYLKYRPQNFASVVGQKHTKKTLESAIEQSNLAHAYLFCGPRGTGKTSMARILAKRINCLNPEKNEPCNTCEICHAIQKAHLVDLIEIDAASNRGIDEIRELREKIGFSPTQATSKVYIIDEVHMLTKEAFNALLKTLEEPPEHAYFILATTEAHKIPETIISRCQQFNFERINTADITERLEEITKKESGTAEKEGLELIATLSQGGLRDAIGLLEQMMANGPITAKSVQENLGLIGHHHLNEFYKALESGKKKEALEQIKELKQQGKSLSQFTRELLHFLQSKLHESIGNQEQTQQLLKRLDAFLEAKRQMDLSPIPELPLEMAVLRDESLEITQNQEKNEALTNEIKPKNDTPLKEEISPAETHVKEVTEVEKEVEATQVSKQVKEEKIETEASTENLTTNTETVSLDLPSIQKKWPRVLEKVPTPFVRMSLSNGELVSYKSQTLNIQFKSSTFKEKVSDSNGQREVQDAIKAVFGGTINLDLKMKEVSLHHQEEKEDKNNTAQMAANVFGLPK